jgi:hypothetical protein
MGPNPAEQEASDAHQMIADIGFEIELVGALLIISALVAP